MKALTASVSFIFLLATGLPENANAEFCHQADSAKLEMNFISSNIANLQTTRTPEGGPYQPFSNIHCSEGGCTFDRDASFIEKYEPDHPDADESGVVKYPNINLMREMENMITASQRYEDAAANCRETQSPRND